MRYNELFENSRNKPLIIVDIQPAYYPWMKINNFDLEHYMAYLNHNNAPVLMFVNAEDQMLTDDTVTDVIEWYNDNGLNENRWQDIKIVDKGYGYFREWMDEGVPENIIIKTIRYMYQQGVNDSRELFMDNPSEYNQNMQLLTGLEEIPGHISINWTSIKQLKKYSGGYIIGGGRDECLKEIQLLMSAFNIKAKEIQEFIY